MDWEGGATSHRVFWLAGSLAERSDLLLRSSQQGDRGTGQETPVWWQDTCKLRRAAGVIFFPFDCTIGRVHVTQVACISFLGFLFSCPQVVSCTQFFPAA
jgi:hypothetical protein